MKGRNFAQDPYSKMDLENTVWPNAGRSKTLITRMGQGSFDYWPCIKNWNMKEFKVPLREEVSPGNQAIFDQITKTAGKVPNLVAFFGYHETALKDLLTWQSRSNTLSAKEKELINLVVSQVNDCKYCVPAHTVLGRMHGFTDDEMLGIRRAELGFDKKLDALAKFVRETMVQHGKPSSKTIEGFFHAGYTEANLIDVCIQMGNMVVSNFLHGITRLPIDWPQVAEI